jgi:hypothetical protein
VSSQLPSGPRGRARVMAWKLANRLPAAIGERMLGRPLFPGEREFSFEAVDLTGGHVTVAVCRG